MRAVYQDYKSFYTICEKSGAAKLLNRSARRETLNYGIVGGDAHIAPQKVLVISENFGKIVTFYNGPMWASAPTDTFFDNLSGAAKLLHRFAVA